MEKSIQNFTFQNPTKILFGKKRIEEIDNEIPKDAKVLILYGGGSVKKNGAFERAVLALGGRDWDEFSGIEANPTFETLMKAVHKVREGGFTYLLVSEIKFSVIGFYAILTGIAGWFSVMKVGYRASRIAAHTSKNIGFQTSQSLIAIANGRLTGKFYGNGLQKYGFLPEIHTDYIFSGYAEENGFLGVVFLLGLYAALLVIIGVALKKIKDLYAKYLLAGIFMIIATQVIGNVAVASQLIPSTGIPLPMMSYGGSTMIAVMMMLGVVYNIIRALYKQEMGSKLDELNEIDYMM